MCGAAVMSSYLFPAETEKSHVVEKFKAKQMLLKKNYKSVRAITLTCDTVMHFTDVIVSTVVQFE